jgi:hypothetical protein
MFLKNSRTWIKTLSAIPLLSLILHCSGDKSTTPTPNQEVLRNVSKVIEFQDDLDSQFTRILAGMDTMAALDSLRQAALADGNVENAEATEQGLIIEYRNGLVGGLFVDPQDEPDGAVFDLQRAPGKESSFQSVGVDTPASTKTVFVNPHYGTRVNHANEILELYNTQFPKLGYERPDAFLDDAATLDVLADLDRYGIVHIYSHGFNYKKNGQTVEILLMTGESANDATTAKYADEIQSGEVPIVKIHLASEKYFAGPKFVSDNNDFSGRKTIFYGGFCYSFLGTWPAKVVTTAGAGAYLGFDWSVRTNWNAYWARSLFHEMTDQSQESPVTVNLWFGDASISKQYWNQEKDRWVKIERKQAAGKDMGLWTRRAAGFNRIGVQVTLDGHYQAQVHTADTSYAYEYDSDGGSHWIGESYPGSLSGLTFNGTYDKTVVGVRTTGTVTAVLSDDKRTIVTLDWTETSSSANFQRTVTFHGVNIPFHYAYSGTSIFQIEGDRAGDSISSFTFVQTATQGLSYSLQSWSTDWNSKVYVSLSVE